MADEDQRAPKTYEICREMVIKLLSAKGKQEKLRMFDAETSEKNLKKWMVESSLATINHDKSATELETEIAALGEADEDLKKREVTREELRQELETEVTELRNWLNNESNLLREGEFPSCFVCKSKEEIDAVDFLRKGIDNVAWPEGCVFMIGLDFRAPHQTLNSQQDQDLALHHAWDLNFQVTILDDDDEEDINHNKCYCCC